MRPTPGRPPTTTPLRSPQRPRRWRRSERCWPRPRPPPARRRPGCGGESPAPATAAQAQAAALAQRCEGARTPGLATVAAAVPLTPREREIAALAAAGIPSNAIAADLVLSVRTVNNHLQRAYTKLGVTSRSGLRAALDLTDGP